MSSGSGDRSVHPFAAFAREPLVFSFPVVPINQAAVAWAIIQPYAGLPVQGAPYAIRGWQVEFVEANCLALTAGANIDVRINGVSCLTGTVTPQTLPNVALGTLVASLPGRRGLLSQQLSVVVTTDGTGTFTDLYVMVVIRPFPLDNEAA